MKTIIIGVVRIMKIVCTGTSGGSDDDGDTTLFIFNGLVISRIQGLFLPRLQKICYSFFTVA